MITKYIHHNEVFVQEHLKGRHREHCLCFLGCTLFKPNTPENCEIAQAVYNNCTKFGITTPMWECPKFSIGEEVEAKTPDT